MNKIINKKGEKCIATASKFTESFIYLGNNFNRVLKTKLDKIFTKDDFKRAKRSHDGEGECIILFHNRQFQIDIPVPMLSQGISTLKVVCFLGFAESGSDL